MFIEPLECLFVNLTSSSSFSLLSPLSLSLPHLSDLSDYVLPPTLSFSVSLPLFLCLSPSLLSLSLPLSPSLSFSIVISCYCKHVVIVFFYVRQRERRKQHVFWAFLSLLHMLIISYTCSLYPTHTHNYTLETTLVVLVTNIMDTLSPLPVVI